MSRFNFKTYEIMKGDADVFSREIGKLLPNPNTPMKTTASIAGGTEDFMSTLSVGQLLMGMPATNSNSYVGSIQERAFATLTGAAMQSTAGGGTAGALQTKGQTIKTAFDYIVPGDITADAKNWVANPASQSGVGSGSGVAGSTNTTGAVTTGSTITGLTNIDFLNQCRSQFGVPYLDTNPQRFGPQYYDCSGFVYTALRKIGLSDPQMPPVSGNDTNGGGQWQWCANHHLNITVDQGIATPGALLFVWNHHVAVSDGQGNAYQAVGRGYLSGSYPARHWGINFDRAGLVPGLQYVSLPAGFGNTGYGKK